MILLLKFDLIMCISVNSKSKKYQIKLFSVKRLEHSKSQIKIKKFYSLKTRKPYLDIEGLSADLNSDFHLVV
jgi:hypothetical protein